MKCHYGNLTFFRAFVFFLILLSFILLLMQGCSDKSAEYNERLQTVTIKSLVLGKDMTLLVYLPDGYSRDAKYPVLYFLHDYGGSPQTVISQYGITDKADKLADEQKITPVIIAAVKIDKSFGINYSQATGSIVTSSEKKLDQGMYENYVIDEVIPYIDTNYSTITSRDGRYIGGYSMGGFAALYLAFQHANMFSKAGGHSPSLFTGDFPDKSVSDWLYPDQDTRKKRDPILIAQEADLSGLSVYLDTGEFDVNVEGCRKMNDILKSKGIASDLKLQPGYHSRGYCYTYMDEYLQFYAGK